MKIETIPIGILGTNCYVLFEENSKEALVIDPGGKSEKLLQLMDEQCLKIKQIIITHGHFDHVSGVKWLLSELEYRNQKTEVFMSFLEKAHMEQKAAPKYQSYFFQANRDIVDQQVLEFGYVQLKALLLPGHTNFSMCFYSEAEKCVFVGDTLFYHSIGTEAYYDGPEEDLSVNIQKILFALPRETIVYPGHKQSTTIDEEMKMNPYLSDADTIDPWL
jgi:hydroxyacylglutathione hydrolase